jgi:hypothetical protein
MLHNPIPFVARRALTVRQKVVLLVTLVLLATTLAAAPSSTALACEGASGSCACPGC